MKCLMILSAAVISSLLPLTSCKHSTEPPIVLPDTTSHNFTWGAQYLGDGNSSMLHDVAIINDTLAYAVGEIYMKDSTGSFDPVVYNVAKWNANRWNIQRIPYWYQGSPYYAAIQSVFAFGENDIWFGIGNLVHWNGVDFYPVPVPAFISKANRLWGRSSQDLFLVGSAGLIYHFNGSAWQSVPSSTTLPIQDIWGGVNSNTGQTEILALASNGFEVPSARRLLRIQGLAVSSVPDSGLPLIMSGLWFSPGEKYYVVGDGLFEKDQIATSTPWIPFHTGLTAYYTEAIRGSGFNDVFIVGHFGTVLHFNGATWHNYQGELSIPNAILHAVAIKGNVAIAVGYSEGKAVVIVGKR